jgi:hypothetical protein
MGEIRGISLARGLDNAVAGGPALARISLGIRTALKNIPKFRNY